MTKWIECRKDGGNFDGEQAQLEITVDYGDGSGVQRWTTAEPTNVWQHRYTTPGVYTIMYYSECGGNIFHFSRKQLIFLFFGGGGGIN